MFPTRPSLPEQGTPGTFASRLVLIADPKQLNHGVGKGKTPTGRTLTGMLIRRSLMQAELNKFLSFRSAWSGTDEQVVQLNAHAS